MKVNVLLNIGTNDAPLPALHAGVHEVDDRIGKAMVDRGLAVDLTPPPKIEAVPPPAAIRGAGSDENSSDESKPSRGQTKPSK